MFKFTAVDIEEPCRERVRPMMMPREVKIKGNMTSLQSWTIRDAILGVKDGDEGDVEVGVGRVWRDS